MKSLVTFLAFLTIAVGASADEKPNRQLAIEYLEAAQFEQVINASTEAYSRQLLARFPANERAQLDKMITETVGWAATKNQIADLVINTYTTAELKSYIAFSKTAAGRSYNQKSVDFSDKFSVVLAHNMQRFIEQNLAAPANPEATPGAPK